MSTSVRKLLTKSLKQIGVASIGNEPNAEDLQDALYLLRIAVDSFNVNSKLIFTAHTLDLPVGGNQQVYTIGNDPSADLVTPVRPQSIQVAMFKNPGSEPANYIEMTILSSDEWARITQKVIQGNTISTYCYLQPEFPLSKLHVWPPPSTDTIIQLTMNQYLDNELTLDSLIVLPPAYERFYMLNVAINFAPGVGIEASDTLKTVYNSVKTDIESLNLIQKTNRLRLDWSTGVYDIRTGTYVTFTG